MQENTQSLFVGMTSGQKILASVVVILGLLIIVMTTIIGVAFYKKNFSAASKLSSAGVEQGAPPSRGIIHIASGHQVISAARFTDTKLILLTQPNESSHKNGYSHIIIWDIDKAKSIQDITILPGENAFEKGGDLQSGSSRRDEGRKE
ncbi:hypothetical protein [Entomobacter blattae]|uniref:Uncharacterized protein n=1 Tax=Entomobacter blattae TaxID=2762277 RepID=A0A7H1NT85_9PROT|nr:hypothetical protein [Entomobacter blattae]QNT78995.1 hypothetical protein JGUZn3_17790 [Entomobacter blattae]